MILIAISWAYILLTVVPLGVITAKWFGIKEKKLPETALLGLFTVTIFASIWAFFGRINFEFHIVLSILCAGIFLKAKSEIIAIFKETIQLIAGFPKSLKILFWITLLVILGQSAAAPFVLDNESYYIQTVKWLNEYGFVKGIANLHVLLAQHSGWHIAQSVYSFSFLYDRFNDLSGFCLLLGNLYAFSRLSEFWKTGDRLLLISALLPLANVFFLRFSGAPSPDIPVYVITFIIADYFIRNYKLPGLGGFNLIVLLTFFVLYIKTSSVLLVLLPVLLLPKGAFRLIRWKIVLLGLVVLALFIGKNCILSGYPLHPLPDFALHVDYALPKDIADLYYIETKIYGYELIQFDYYTTDAFGLLKRWITLPRLHGLVNRFTVMVVLIAPLFIRKFLNKKAVWLLYFTMVLQLAVLLYAGPQYRYYLNFVLVSAMICASGIVYKKQFIIIVMSVSMALSLLLLIIPFELEAFTKNENTKQNTVFAFGNILIPHPNSKLDVSYEMVRKGNIRFNSPVKSGFFWATGNGELPCASKEQLDYISNYYKVYPQLRTPRLKDGFYSKTN